MGRSVPKYTEDFKRNLVSLYHNGKSQSQLRADFGVSAASISKWVKIFSDDIEAHRSPRTRRQFHELKKRVASLEEENLVLKRTLAVFTLH